MASRMKRSNAHGPSLKSTQIDVQVDGAPVPSIRLMRVAEGIAFDPCTGAGLFSVLVPRLMERFKDVTEASLPTTLIFDRPTSRLFVSDLSSTVKPAAVEMMNIAMGIVGEGALPKQVEA